MKRPRLRLTWLLTALLPLLSPPAARAADAKPDGQKLVASLDGRPIIREDDLADYSASQACYGEDAITSRKASFMRLLEASVAEEAMRAHNGPAPSAADLKADAERIDRETRAPDILACIKRHFEKNPDRYLKIFVWSSLVESRFRLFLMNDPGVQGPPHEQAQKALDVVQKGGSFEAAARDLGITYSSTTYSLKESTGTQSPAALARYGLPWSPYEADFIKQNLMSLAPGQMRAEPLDTGYDIRLVRLLSKSADGQKWTFESLSARKQSQEDWLKSLKKMKLKVDDKELADWVSGIHGNPRLLAVDIVPAAKP